MGNQQNCFIASMNLELGGLESKINELNDFISSDVFYSLDDSNRILLVLQLESMMSYKNILKIRLGNINTKIENVFMSFAKAISFLKQGYCLARKGWNGKNIYICIQVPTKITSDIIPKMQSLPQAAKEMLMYENLGIEYRNQMLIINKSTGVADSWVPSSSDLFAEDWIIMNGPTISEYENIK